MYAADLPQLFFESHRSNEHVKVVNILDSECKMATLRNLDRLQSLKLKTERYFHQGDISATFLCSRADNYFSARAFGSFAFVLFSDSFLSQSPEPVVQTVAIHEMIHLRLGSELRNALEVMHPDVALLMHKSIIDSWLNEEVEILSDGDYILDKGDKHEIEDRGNGICNGETFPKTPKAGF